MLLRLASVVAVLVLSVSTPTFAITLAPGDTSPLGGGSITSMPSLAGTIIDSESTPVMITTDGGGILFTGSWDSQVIRESAGTLDFYYRITSSPQQVTGIDLPNLGNPLSLVGFSGFSTDVNFRSDELGTISPNVASRTSDGSTIHFSFPPPPFTPPVGNVPPTPAGSDFNPGDTTSWFFVRTDATKFQIETSAILTFTTGDAGLSPTNVSAPVPIADGAVPELNSAVLIPLGIVAMAIKLRRRVPCFWR